MSNEEQLIEKKKEKIIKWIRNPYNLGLVLVILLAVGIRLYYFFITKNQPLWWDEAEYMSTAKHWVFNLPYEVNPQRPPLFQFLAAVFLYLNFSISAIKFMIVFIPSIFLVFVTYLVGKEMFSKKVGLFAALSTGFMWSYLFWTERFQPDFFSMCFQMLSFLFFWKLIKNPDKKYAIYTGLFTALGFYFKISALLVPVAMFIFVLYKDGIKFIYKKEYWTIVVSFLISLIPFMLWQFMMFGNPIAFAPSYTHGITEDRPLGWMALSFFNIFPKTLFFILFLIGLSFLAFRLFLTYDLLFKDKEKRTDPELFSLIILVVISLFYIFYIQGVIEDRWVFLIAPFIFYFSALGFFKIQEKINSYSKLLGFILIVLVLGFFIYTQVQHTTQLINIKKDSYYQIKDASLWIKENSEKSDAILSVSYTQTIAYSDRPVYTYSRMSQENFTKLMLEKRPRYLIASIIEPNHPEWMIQTQQYQDGSWAIILPYMNSSVYVMQNNQIKTDLKNKIVRPQFNFTLVYPTSDVNGLFVYKIDYN